MNETELILSQLRDIQVPPAPEGVSAWLIAANLILLLLVLLGLYRRRLRRKERWRRDALRQVSRARRLESPAAMLVLARTLRQIMLYRQDEISADGHAWLVQLDSAFGTHWFTQAEGRAFGADLYRQTSINDEKLQGLCTHLERLIRKLPTRSSKNRLQDEQLPTS